MFPSILLFNPFEKGFVHATSYTNKSGKLVHRKAYTDKRIAKKVVAKDRIRTPWTKDKTYNEVKEKLHTERDSLKKKLEDVRAHKEELLEAKKKGDTHTKRGIKVDQKHHLDTHEKNTHEKLENINHKIMLHASHSSLQREKIEETREKARTKRQATSKEFKDQSEYMDWYRKQSPKIKDEHKLNKTDGKLIASWGDKKPLPEKAVVVKKEVQTKDLKRKLTEVESKRVTSIENIGPSSRLQMGKLDGKNVVKNMNTDGEWHFQPKISELVAAKKKEDKPKPKKIVVPKEKEIPKSEAEKSKNRSEGMKGNKNAFKGGPKDETKNIIVPKDKEIKTNSELKITVNLLGIKTAKIGMFKDNEPFEVEVAFHKTRHGDWTYTFGKPVDGKFSRENNNSASVYKLKSKAIEAAQNEIKDGFRSGKSIIHSDKQDGFVKQIALESDLKRAERSIKDSESAIIRLKADTGKEEAKKYKDSDLKVEFGSDDFGEQLESNVKALNEKRRANRIKGNNSAIKDHRENIEILTKENKSTRSQLEVMARPSIEDSDDSEGLDPSNIDDDFFGFLTGKSDSPDNKTESEKTKSRSEGQLGNKNAYKGGPKEEPTKAKIKKVKEPEKPKKLPIVEVAGLSISEQKKYFGAMDEEGFEDLKKLGGMSSQFVDKAYENKKQNLKDRSDKLSEKLDDLRKRNVRRNNNEFVKYYSDQQKLRTEELDIVGKTAESKRDAIVKMLPVFKDFDISALNNISGVSSSFRHSEFIKDLQKNGIELSVQNKRDYLIGDQKNWLVDKAIATTPKEYAEKLGIDETKAEGIARGFGQHLLSKYSGTTFFSKPNTDFDALLSDYWQKNKAKHSGREIEVKKDEFKPKISKDNHHDYSDDDHGFILPDLSTKGFVKFTKLELKGEGHETVKRAVKEFESLKKSLIKSEGLERKPSDRFHPSNYKVDGGYQIVDGRIFMRVSVSRDKYIYRKEKEEPSKRPQSRKSFIYSPDVQLGSEGIVELKSGWKAEMEMQRTLYNQINHKSSQTENLLTDVNTIGGTSSRHEFFQKAHYNEETGMIESKLETSQGKISATFPISRFKMMLSFYNEGQRRGFSSGYVVPEKNLSPSVRDAMDLLKADQDASRERISSTYYEAYLEGRETSFGTRNVEKDILDSHGVLIKRQNGKELSSDDKEALKKVVGDTYAAIGNSGTLSKMARDKKLKISFSGDKMAYLTKAVGLYVPTESTVVIGRQMTQVLPHEFAHFMDDHLGDENKKGRGSYASEMTHTSAGKATILGRRHFTKGSKRTQAPGGYWNRSCEVFARMVEQYAAVNHYNDESYYSRDGYWTKEKYKLIKPEIEKVLKEKFGKSFSDLFNKKFSSMILFKVS